MWQKYTKKAFVRYYDILLNLFIQIQMQRKHQKVKFDTDENEELSDEKLLHFNPKITDINILWTVTLLYSVWCESRLDIIM